MNKKTHDGNCQFAILANFLSVRIYVERFYVERFYDCMMKPKISTQKCQQMLTTQSAFVSWANWHDLLKCPHQHKEIKD